MSKELQDMMNLQGEIKIYLMTNPTTSDHDKACALLDMVLKSELCKDGHKREYAQMK